MAHIYTKTHHHFLPNGVLRLLLSDEHNLVPSDLGYPLPKSVWHLPKHHCVICKSAFQYILNKKNTPKLNSFPKKNMAKKNMANKNKTKKNAQTSKYLLALGL